MYKLAVIGDPISHSLSPSIHKEILGRLNIECEYTAVNVKKGMLHEWIESAKKEGINGFNATMPHKIDIMEYIEEENLGTEAKLCRSVNTVTIKDGILYGDSTDGGGFCMSLRERGITLANKHVLIAGKGGVGAVLMAVAGSEGAKSVTALGRNDLCDIKTHAAYTDIFINATPLGMQGCESDWDDMGFVKLFPPHTVIFDTIYNPLQTALLSEARERGLTVINGLSMLVCQAVLADLIFLSAYEKS